MDAQLHQYAIGGSEVGAIFGCDDFKDAFSLWSQKKHPEIRTAPGWRAIIGKALEEGVLRLYTIVTGREVEYCDKTFVHPERPWMVYTPDGFVKGERRGVDAKVVFYDQRHKWGATAHDIPVRVMLQCWWYMAALDFDVWDVCALVGDEQPRVYTIEREPAGEAMMLERVREWHQRFLVGNETPPPGPSDESGEWLQRMFPTHARPDLRPADEREVLLLDELVDVRLAQTSCSGRRAELENMLKLAIGTGEGLTWDGGKFTWRKVKDGEKVDWESIARGLFKYAEPDERATLLSMHTSPKPGVRRALLQAARMSESEAA